MNPKNRLQPHHRFLISLSVLVASLLCASDLRASADLVGRLDNGMDVVLVENHSSGMVAANLVVRVGSRDETWDTWGAAHFLEHMLFNGTPTRSQEEIYAALDRISAYCNAHTGTQFTDLMLLAPGSCFSAGLEILADIAFNSTLPAEKFEKERGIVMEEIARSQNSDSGVQSVERLLSEALFEGSALSRPVLGTQDAIARLERDSVMAFYRRWFGPNNMLLFVSGSFAADTMFSWLNGELSGFPPRELPPRMKLEPPDFASLSQRGLAHRRISGDRRDLVVAQNAPRPGEPQFIPFLMLTLALERRLEESLPPGVTSSGDLILDPDFSVYEVHLSAPSDGPNGDSLLYALDGIISSLGTDSPDSAEIARLARRYHADRVFDSERLHHFGIVNAGYWALVPWDEFDSWPRRLELVTPEQIGAAVDRWLPTSRRLAMIFEATPGGEPGAAPQYGIEIQKFTPPEGPTVIVRSDPSAPVFALHVLVRDRWLWDGEYGAGAVDLLHQLIVRSARDVETGFGLMLDELAAELKTTDDPAIPYDDYYTSPEFSFLRLQMLPDRWREGVALTAALMSRLPLDSSSLAHAREASGRAAAQQRSPVVAGSQRLWKALVPGSPLAAAVYGDPYSLEAGEIEELRRRCFHPRNLIVSVSSPAPAGQVAEVIVGEFKKLATGEFRPPQVNFVVPDQESSRLPRMRDTLTVGKSQGAIVMGAVIAPIDTGDVAALILANAYLGKRMSMELRERQGLAYLLGSSLKLRPAPGGGAVGYWELYIATRPENLPRAEDGIRALIEELPRHSFSSGELEKLAGAASGGLMMRSMPRIGQAYVAATGEYFWGTPKWDEVLMGELRRVSPAAVCAAAERLSAERIHTVVVK